MNSTTMDSLRSSRRKPNTASNAGRNRSVKSIDITLKDTNRKKENPLHKGSQKEIEAHQGKRSLKENVNKQKSLLP